jgi:hypothetical protein
MTTTAPLTFRIHPMSSEVLDDVRAGGLDASGNPAVPVTAEAGWPLRCCLRNARAGEACLLFNYEPELPAGTPYREVGAVFAHAAPCEGPASDEAYPADWIGRPQVLRAYDARGWIHPATRVHDGSAPWVEISEMLDDADVAEIHSRNIAYGCYMFRITR